MKSLATALLAAGALLGCAAPYAPAAGPTALPPTASPAAPGPGAALRYRCDQNVEFTVRFTDDSAVIETGSRGKEVLLRDAGGLTPQQTVYSNPRLRAEFGLGASNREAILRFLQPPAVANCLRD